MNVNRQGIFGSTIDSLHRTLHTSSSVRITHRVCTLLTVHVALVRHILDAIVAFVADVLHLVLVEVAGATTFTE